MRSAHEIKALSEVVWGSQGGLLSESELALLMKLIKDEAWPGDRILEVGHFYGLSTCGILEALSEVGQPKVWLTTVDNHKADGSVGDSDAQCFLHNLHTYMRDDEHVELEIFLVDSQSIVRPIPHNIVFYDGDHREEQERFTRLVLESPNVRVFIFDDGDYAVPARCCELLKEAGWKDESPTLWRGPEDKRTPDTMTLKVFRRS